MSRPTPTDVAKGAALGVLVGLCLFGLEELANLVYDQPPLEWDEVVAFGACYAGALGASGALLVRLRSDAARLLALMAVFIGLLVGAKVAEELWWAKLTLVQADLVGFPLGIAAALAGTALVLRWTRTQPGALLGLGAFGLVAFPTFRAVNINAFGAATEPGALAADAVILLLGGVAGGLGVAWARRNRPVIPALGGLALVSWSAVIGGRLATAPEPATPAAAASSPDVLLVVVDTLRADHLGAWGHHPEVSPNIDALAARGVRYAAAGSPAGWTLPSFASIATGLYPAHHGAGVNTGEGNTQATLDDAAQTLAEVMSAAGYRTGAVVSNPYLKRSFGIARGFDTYDDALGLGHTPMVIHPLRMLKIQVMHGRYFYRQADRMVDAATAWWRAAEGGPRFLMVHLMDPHDPYNPPQADLDAVAALGIAQPPHTRTEPDLVRYDAEIRFMDRELARLLAEVGDDTIVALTSDHGEEWGERDDPYPGDHWPPTRHGHTLYQELLAVPLVVAGPGIEPEVVQRPVRSFDITATIPRLAGVFTPAGFAADAEPLWEAVGQTRATADDSAVGAQALRFATEKRAVRVGSWKLIETTWGDELYDLAADPGERNNLAGAQPERVEALRARLPPPTVADAAAADIDEQTRKELEALGYIQD